LISATPQAPVFSATPVSGLILAGGRARRMGNVDKCLQLLDGEPLVSRVFGRLAPQVAEVLVNANRHADIYAALGHRVIADRIGEFAGPLAGLHVGLSEARHAFLVSVPCDTPFLPQDLVARLLAPLEDDQLDLTVARTGSRAHPVICLTRRRLLPHLSAYMQSGGRKMDGWYSTLRALEVNFSDENAFRNINTLEDLKAASTRREP
jgi:molybdopterin-guanine dinucleotide biosynthesis protein A